MPATITTFGPPLELADFVADAQPSAVLKLSMSRRIDARLVAEETLRPFLLRQLRELLPTRMDELDFERADAVRRITYGKAARRVVLVELADAELAAALREQLHDRPCELLAQRALYVEFVLRRKEKEARDAFERVVSVSRTQALTNVSARVPGLVLVPEFISRDEEAVLLALLERDDGAHWKHTVKARQVQHFGFEFSYETRRCDERAPLAEMPPAMRALAERLSPTLMDATPDQITVNEYKPGQGIPAHIDTHSAFTGAIASLSLASEVVMELRHPSGRVESVLCQPRSLLVLTGASRYEWTHAIPPRAFDVLDGERVARERRVSITFRKVQSTPCTCAFPVQCDSRECDDEPAPTGATGETDTLAPTHVEQQYVHEFYETVASHFSSTRYNAWPRVAAFVRSLAPGSLVADIGCGNGKYMKCVGADSVVIGGDRSASLAAICQQNGQNVMVCDAMLVPIRSASCDAALSIAVLHHLSTQHHRLAAVKELVRVLRVGGRGVIYAWAHEQKASSKRQFDASKQDFMVPWNLDRRFAQPRRTDAAAASAGGDAVETAAPIVVQRYCHMFKEGELEQLVATTGDAEVEDHYYDESNWAVVLRRVS